MPGPGHGKTTSNKSSKPKAARSVQFTPSAVQDPFPLRDIDGAEGWANVVSLMCDFYKIPDLTTRKGLKKVHAEFKHFYDLLDAAYKKNSDNDRITGAVIGIFAKMCVDSILRDKLFKEGLLKKLLPLLDKPTTRHLAIRALSTVTHHGGTEARIEIARQTPTLLQLIESNPTDHLVAELAVSTLSHAVGAITYSPDTPDPKLLKVITASKLIKVVTEVIRTVPPTVYLMGHALELLAGVTRYCPNESRACPSMINFLVACLRSNNLIFRCNALGGLINLHTFESEFDRSVLDPNKVISQVKRGFPAHLQHAMVDYGVERCDTHVTLRTMTEFTNVMMKCAQDQNLHALGLTLVEFVLRTEFSMVDGGFQTMDSTPSNPKFLDVGLPFIRWKDAFPPCIAAIRQKGKATEQHLADILELKSLIAQQCIQDATAFAKECIVRNPSVPYFYYAITLSADGPEGLRHAKKGLMCKQITPFVRFQLTQRAVEHAGIMGLHLLQQSRGRGDKLWEEGIAFLTSALEDAKVFVEEAPPDSRHMKGVLYWYCLLTITLKGPEVSKDLSDLKDKFDKLRQSEDFGNVLGLQLPKTQLRLTYQTTTKLYSAAFKEWGPVINDFNSISSSSSSSSHTPSPSKAEDDLAAWLEANEDEGASMHEHCISHPKLTDGSNVELYRCSWCGNPSAVLRKCSGCSKARYCEASCQRAHWKDHKPKCKPPTASA